jgi:hypothetical protein
LNGAGVFGGRIIGLRGLGQDPTLVDPTSGISLDTLNPTIDTSFSPIGVNTMQPIDVPQNVYPVGFVGPLPSGSVELSTPAAVSQDQTALTAAVPTVFPAPASNPTGANPPPGAIGFNSVGQWINAAGAVVGATAQIYSAAQLGRPALTAAQLASGAVGYNAAGQLVNAQGQVISASLIPGLSNTTLMIGGGVLVLLALMMGGKK